MLPAIMDDLYGNDDAAQDMPALVASPAGFVLLSADGEVETGTAAELDRVLRGRLPLFCHRGLTSQYLGERRIEGFDILELFAFACPGRNVVPLPSAILRSVTGEQASASAGPEQACLDIFACRDELLAELARPLHAKRWRDQAVAIAWMMQRGAWNWAPYVLAALDVDAGLPPEALALQRILEDLPDWEDGPSHGGGGDKPVSADDAALRLQSMLGPGGRARDNQQAFAAAIAKSFDAVDLAKGRPLVLAEAGTGTGKTMGYLAPASLWAERNDAPVWISTYTRNLQHQIESELERLEPDAARRARRFVVRKGRENYLCLLNLEEALRQAGNAPRHAVSAGLMLRWALASRAGDLTGDSFPSWLPELFGGAATLGLSDRRGECIYSACPHYRRCFIEKNQRAARGAELVISNHALTMIRASMAHLPDWEALGASDAAEAAIEAAPEERGEEDAPLRFVFDEGHHVFNAADSAFAVHLTGQETADLRRWIRGVEGNAKSRLKGLRARLEDLQDKDERISGLVADIGRSARVLPREDWLKRIREGSARGPGESFFAQLHGLVMARSPRQDSLYSLEVECSDLPQDLRRTAGEFASALDDLAQVMGALAKYLRAKMKEDQAQKDRDLRRRLEAIGRGLWRRGPVGLASWIDMLEHLASGAGQQKHDPADGEGDDVPAFYDWLQVERRFGRDSDVGLYRHWVDPGKPFAEVVLSAVPSAAVTSATLTDQTGEADKGGWDTARRSIGAAYSGMHVSNYRFASPFDYKNAARIIVVTDVPQRDLDARAAAYGSLFEASEGGVIGLFTAIERLRAMHARLALPLQKKGYRLMAQHIDRMSVAGLIDLFRETERACLLGTDALRDGVDIPGDALRMMVLDRVPWHRPSLLHKARRAAFGGRAYDEAVTRMRIKQAFGRLIRKETDKGVFVCLDPGLPSRLCSAFPQDCEILRLPLADALHEVRAFLHSVPEPV